MITREQVADLQPGDVVEISGYPSMHGASMTGPLWAGEERKLCVGPFIVRHRDGSLPTQYEDDDDFTLTVVSRVPRLFVNHPRTEPVPGDVVRDADGDNKYRVWVRDTRPPRWTWADHPAEDAGDLANVRLRLLVDGTTGQVVPS